MTLVIDAQPCKNVSSSIRPVGGAKIREILKSSGKKSQLQTSNIDFEWKKIKEIKIGMEHRHTCRPEELTYCFFLLILRKANCQNISGNGNMKAIKRRDTGTPDPCTPPPKLQLSGVFMGGGASGPMERPFQNDSNFRALLRFRQGWIPQCAR